jgi:hypothetical protein
MVVKARRIEIEIERLVLEGLSSVQRSEVEVAIERCAMSAFGSETAPGEAIPARKRGTVPTPTTADRIGAAVSDAVNGALLR